MLRLLGMVAMMTGDLDACKLRFVEALRIAQQIDHRIAQYYSLAALSWHHPPSEILDFQPAGPNDVGKGGPQ